MSAAARARSNLALVKYWGKRDEALVLPFTGSLSMTLDALHTDTVVEFTRRAGGDELVLDDAPTGEQETARATALLDLVRAQIPGLGAARIRSRNSFPTAGGLASSASGFAALAAAASWAAGLDPSPRELSLLARRASGSACRSVLGGFVEWVRGEADDGSDSFAQQLLAPGAWDVAMVVAIVEADRKQTSSRDAMRDSVRSSPYFAEWLKTTARDLHEARAAIGARDLERLGTIAERSFLAMHAVAMTSTPPALFWKPATLEVLEEVRRLRADGVGAWATVDAGPHVAVLCEQDDVARVWQRLGALPGVREIVVARPGPGVERL